MPSVFSKRLNADVHLGKLAPQPVKDAIEFQVVKAIFLKAGGTLPPFPTHFGYGGDFKPGPVAQGGWGMFGNGPCDDGSITDQAWAAYKGAGDCAWAGPGHEEMESAKNAGRPVPQFTCLNILNQYSAYSGYNLQTGASDNGSAVADVIAWRQSKGLLDVSGTPYKIGQAFTLTPGNLQELWEAAYLLENVGLGIVLTEANMQQFDNGQPWDADPNGQQIGGHYIPAVGRANPNNSGIITWAQRQGITQAFYEQQADEAHGYLDPLRYNSVTGQDAEHYNDEDVERFFQTLAQNQQQAAA
jgi:hypothetical protein